MGRTLGEIAVAVTKAQAGAEQAVNSLDQKWTAAAKEAAASEIQAGLQGYLTECRQEAAEAHKAALAEAEAADYAERLKLGPQNPEEWAQASARAAFIAADLAGLEPEEIVKVARAALGAKDRPGLYLVEKLGRPLLEGMQHKDGLRIRAAVALEALDQLYFGAANEARSKRNAAIKADYEAAIRAIANATPPAKGQRQAY